MRHILPSSLVLFAALVAAPRSALACGGCFVPPPASTEKSSVVTAHRMVLSISTEQTILLRSRSRHGLLVAHAVVGLGFAVLELSAELTAAADLVYRSVGFCWRSWSDPTDLFALTVFPASFHLCLRASSSPARTRSGPGALERAALFVGLLACAASSGDPSIVEPCTNQACYEVPPPQDRERSCEDGLDNDGDAKPDCEDLDCATICEDLVKLCQKDAVLLPGTVELSGDTSAYAGSITDSGCVGADSPEVLFLLDVPYAGTLWLTIPEGHGASVRAECTDSVTTLACHDGDTEMSGERLEVAVDAPGHYALIFEAIDPFSTGPFTVPVYLRREGCGDGVRDGLEACDDGNDAFGDGCSAICDIEYSFLCSTEETIPIGAHAGSLSGGTSLLEGPCGGSVDAFERVYLVFPPASGTLTVSASAATDVLLWAASSCGERPPDVVCENAAAAGGQERLELEVVQNQGVYIFVEAAGPPDPDPSFVLDLAMN